MPLNNTDASSNDDFTSSPNGDSKLRNIEWGQRLIIIAIVINISVMIAQIVINPILGLLGIIGFALAITGVVRLALGLGRSVGYILIMIVLMIVPIVNLVTLLVLNSRATKILKSNGYKVGLFGGTK